MWPHLPCFFLLSLRHPAAKQPDPLSFCCCCCCTLTSGGSPPPRLDLVLPFLIMVTTKLQFLESEHPLSAATATDSVGGSSSTWSFHCHSQSSWLIKASLMMHSNVKALFMDSELMMHSNAKARFFFQRWWCAQSWWVLFKGCPWRLDHIPDFVSSVKEEREKYLSLAPFFVEVLKKNGHGLSVHGVRKKGTSLQKRLLPSPFNFANNHTYKYRNSSCPHLG